MIGVSGNCAFLCQILFLPLIVLPLFHPCLSLLTSMDEDFQLKYSHFPESLRLEMVNETKKMFYFGYDNCMNFGILPFPWMSSTQFCVVEEDQTENPYSVHCSIYILISNNCFSPYII